MFAGATASYTQVEALNKDDEEELEKSTGISDIDESLVRIIGSNKNVTVYNIVVGHEWHDM